MGFIDRAVAARRNDQIKPVRHGFRRESARDARRGRGLERALRADDVKLATKAPRFFAARRWIKNHARWHARMICGSRTVSRGESELRLPRISPKLGRDE